MHERGLCVLGAGQALVERVSGGAERVAHPLCRPRVTDVVRATRGHPWVVEQPMIARRASSRRFACLDLAHQLLDHVANLELLTLPTLRRVSPRRPARLERVRWGWRGSRLASVGWLALAPALALALLGLDRAGRSGGRGARGGGGLGRDAGGVVSGVSIAPVASIAIVGAVASSPLLCMQ